MATPASVNSRTTRSIIPPRCIAARMPSGIDSTTLKMIVTVASSTVAGR